MLTNQKITDFLEKTASGTPVPGGGSVSALSAALGASLAEMVANLTIGKKGYEAVETEMKDIAETLQNLRRKLALAVVKRVVVDQVVGQDRTAVVMGEGEHEPLPRQ